MVANLKSLVIPIGDLPKVDTSWLTSLGNTIGDALDKASQNKSFEQNVIPAITGQAAPAQQPGFLGRLFGQTAAASGAQQQVAATNPNPSGLDGYYAAIRQAESGGDDNAKAPTSSATGRYQFTTGTWNGLMQTHPELGLTNDGRTNPAQQEAAIRAFTQDNAKTLASGGIPVTPGNLYAAHFLGAGGARSVLGGDDSSPVSAYVDQSVVSANPFLSRMSVGQFKQWAASKGGNGSGGYAAPAPTQVASLDPSAGMGSTGQQIQATSPAPQTSTAAAPTGQGTQQPYVDPQVAASAPAPIASTASSPAAGMPAPQSTNSGPSILAAGQPVSRSNISNEQIAQMVRDPNTRAVGLQLWQQVLGKSGDSPYEFSSLGDGTLVRQNKQTGAVESIGTFAKPQAPVSVGADSSLVDPTTGRVVYQGQKPQFTQLTPDEVKAQGLDPAKAYQRGPDNRVYQIGGDGTQVNVKTEGNIPAGYKAERDKDGNIIQLDAIPGGPADKLTEDQGKATGFLARSTQSEKTLEGLESQGTSLWNSTAGRVPVVGNYARSQDAQKYDQAKRDFVNAILRRESGAAISPGEFDNAEQQYFPVPGDGPDVIAQKRANRQAAIQGLQISSGPGAQQATPQGSPQIGAVEDGYRFKGGNPADPQNWEKAQ